MGKHQLILLQIDKQARRLRTGGPGVHVRNAPKLPEIGFPCANPLIFARQSAKLSFQSP
jgi:hypothetical protein